MTLCSKKFESLSTILGLLFGYEMLFFAGLEWSGFPEAGSFKLNKVVSWLHGPLERAVVVWMALRNGSG